MSRRTFKGAEVWKANGEGMWEKGPDGDDVLEWTWMKGKTDLCESDFY